MRQGHVLAARAAAVAVCSILPTSVLATDWPVGNGTTNQAIYSTYGQYYEGPGGGLHFHEGVDIAVAAGTDVRARLAGTIIAIDKTNATPENRFVIIRSGAVGTVGENLFHMDAAAYNRPALNNGLFDPGGPWAVGDSVYVGDLIGKVSAFSAGNHPAHLHVDRGSGTDPYGGSLNFPQINMLENYSPNVDANDPVPHVPLGFHYLRADHDRLGVVTNPYGNGQLGSETERNDNRYFRTLASNGKMHVGRRANTTADNSVIAGTGSGDVDILASAWDSAGPATQYHNGVHKLQLKIRGSAFNDGTADDGTGNGPNDLRNIWHFTGQFVDDGTAPGHEYAALRSSNLTRVPYANDTYSNSSDNSNGNAANYWYIATNNDDDTIVEAGDRNRYWNTDVVAGSRWNNVAAADATSNATSAFRDDIYSINVIATDVRGGIGSTVEEIVLDNWEQTLVLDALEYQPTDTVNVIGGDQYDDLQTLPLFVLPAAPAPNSALSGLWGNTGTDANGSVIGVPLGQYALGDYWVVSDYNMDGKFMPELDGLAAFAVVPEPVGFGVALLSAAALGWRRRRSR